MARGNDLPLRDWCLDPNMDPTLGGPCSCSGPCDVVGLFASKHSQCILLNLSAPDIARSALPLGSPGLTTKRSMLSKEPIRVLNSFSFSSISALILDTMSLLSDIILLMRSYIDFERRIRKAGATEQNGWMLTTENVSEIYEIKVAV